MATTTVTEKNLPAFVRRHVAPVVREIIDENVAQAKSEAVREINKSRGMPDVLANALSGDKGTQTAAEPFTLARLIRSMAAGKGDTHKALQYAKEKLPKDKATKEATGIMEKALAASDFDAGGSLTVEQVAPGVIERLTNRVAVRALGATSLPMPGGSLTLNKITAGPTAEYIGENAGQNASQPTTGQVKLVAKKLRATVPISNDLLRFASPAADTIVTNDAVRELSVKEDATFLRSAGTENEPKGLLSFVLSANDLDANATDNLTNLTNDLSAMVLRLHAQNVDMQRVGWIFAPRTWARLMSIRDGNGNFAFRPEMLGGTLWSWPFVSTNQVPITLDDSESSNDNESEIYLVDFQDVVIGDATALEIEVSREASYRDASGNLVSAYDLDQTVVRLISQHDLGLRHDESVVVMREVVYGA